MSVMLDTNTCIYLIRGDSSRMRARFDDYEVGDVLVSSIVVAELEFGVANSGNTEKNRAALEKFLATLRVVAFDRPAATDYGVIRADLRRRGTPIGSLDLLIAGHARSLGATVVTNNVREFSRVPGLVVENWVETN
jgi:tRNA(fMet)-specific endonuclease VapC